MLLPNILAVVFISLAFVAFLGGILGWWGKPIHFSDKVDLFYVEPRISHVQQARQDRQKISQRNDVCVRKPSQGRVVLGRKAKPTPVHATVQSSERRVYKPVARTSRQALATVAPEVFRDCVDTLVALGFKAGDAKREVQRFTQSNQIVTVQQFLDDYYKRKT